MIKHRVLIIVLVMQITFILLIISISFIYFIKFSPFTFYINQYQNIPVLIYHGVTSDYCESEYSTGISVIKKQMEYLRINNYTPISLHDYCKILNGTVSKPEKPIIITFHDNHIGWYQYAFPLLRKYNYKASFFVITKVTPENENNMYCSWRQLLKMANWKNLHGNKLFSIESHSMSHASLSHQRKKETIEQYRQRIFNELLLSSKMIEENIGIKPMFFALPFSQGWSKVAEREILIKQALSAGYAGIQKGGLYSEGYLGIGGFVIHNSHIAMDEFYLTLSAFNHNSLFFDFSLWNKILIKKLYYKFFLSMIGLRCL